MQGLWTSCRRLIFGFVTPNDREPEAKDSRNLMGTVTCFRISAVVAGFRDYDTFAVSVNPTKAPSTKEDHLSSILFGGYYGTQYRVRLYPPFGVYCGRTRVRHTDVS